MRRFFQIFLPVILLCIAGFIVMVIVKNPTKPKTRKAQVPKVFVESFVAKKTDFPVSIITQGEVAPRIKSKIIPEVSGKIVEVSDNFFAGKFFKKDEVLLKLDPRDYEIALAKAKADLVKAETDLEQEKIRTQNFKTAIINSKNTLQKNILTLKEETARGEQALLDWKKLGRPGEPGELVLRKPQMEAAKAAVDAAKADIEMGERNLSLTETLLKNSQAAVDAAKAEVRMREINLERCQIRAPFDGRIIAKSVDIGQYVSPGNPVADIYGIEAVEVMLPISPKELMFIDLPGISPKVENSNPEVVFSTQLGNETITWKGLIDRSDSMVDSKSRQYNVIGQVKNPFEGEHTLKPGTFVKAEIKGKTLENVFVLPISAVRESSFVWSIDNEMKLNKQPVKIIWRNLDTAVVTGLNDGEKICRTALTFARNGLVVTEKGTKPAK